MDDRTLIDHARGLCLDAATALFDVGRRLKSIVLRARVKRLELELRTLSKELSEDHDADPPTHP